MDVQVGWRVEWFHTDGKLHSGVVTRLWKDWVENGYGAYVPMASISDNRGYLVHVEVGKLWDPRQGCALDDSDEGTN